MPKIGIPCSHIIKIIWNQKMKSFLEFFNPRWIVQKENHQQKKAAEKGPGRKSRRNWKT
jgi:hypothetical protein